jgi:hypothetical protein
VAGVGAGWGRLAGIDRRRKQLDAARGDGHEETDRRPRATHAPQAAGAPAAHHGATRSEAKRTKCIVGEWRKNVIVFTCIWREGDRVTASIDINDRNPKNAVTMIMAPAWKRLVALSGGPRGAGRPSTGRRARASR